MFLYAISALFAFKKEDMMKALEIFWKGMLAIVIVMVIVIFVTWLMNRIANREKKAPTQEGTDSQNTDDQLPH